MNMKDIMIFVGVAAAAYMLLSRKSAAKIPAGATEIQNNALQGQSGYGWRYFSDGTAISPGGDYYKNGGLIYQAAYNGVTVGANYSNLAV
ncbi:MAG TPA: hypothetical protein VJ698_15725 [Noviherbaspirillum sp.]|uniref:hypothetical protein n=1 Tax=Noviherbaspirillum sp. TaxID=1926288 RepID=UPI002B4893FE|nr:hypothetical protein [Noviherbaspirillum sp.]HJV86915.1 hypothetical protein [Noviherbaspirillum sp.]